MNNSQELKQFVNSGGAIFLSIGIGTVFIFLFKLISARYLGAENFGLIEMSVTILGLLSMVAGLGLYSAFQRFIPIYKNKSKINGLIYFIHLFQLVSSILLAVILIFFSKSITDFFGFDNKFTPLLFVVAITLPFMVFRTSYQSFFLAYKKSLIAHGGYEILSNSVLIIGAIILVFAKLSLVYFVILYLIANMLSFLFFFILSKPLLPKTAKRRYEIKRWVNYSMPLLFAGIIAYILNWTDNFVIGKFLDASQLGIYAIAFSLAMYIFMFSRLFLGVFLPIMTKSYTSNKDEFIFLFRTIRRWTTLFSMITGSVLILFSYEILLFLFGKDYTSGSLSLKVLSFFIIIANYFFYHGQILRIVERTKLVFWANLITLILNLFISIILVQKMGIVGVAIGTGFSFFLVRFLLYFFSKKYVTIPHDYFFVLKSIVLSFLTAGVSFLIYNLVLVDFSIFIFIPILSTIYLLLLILGLRYLRLLKKEDEVIFDVIEARTKINLKFVKSFFIK